MTRLRGDARRSVASARRRCPVGRWVALAIGCTFVAQSASAVQCSLAVQAVDFGAYDVFSNRSVDGTGSLQVSCDVAAPYSIVLSAGSGAYAARVMSQGPYTLMYNLFTDPALTTVCGDGSAGTAVVTGNTASATIPVYGRIPARQNAHVGPYADTIVVIVEF
jgi:spore coat protein U-like protein